MARKEARIYARPGTAGGPSLARKLSYYAMVSDGVMVLKDRPSPLLGGFWYEGVDHENASSDDLSALIRSASHAFAAFGRGWMLHFQVMRSAGRNYRPGNFQDPVDQLLDEDMETRATFWNDECAVFLTHAPSLSESLGSRPDDVMASLQVRASAFDRKLDEFARSMSRVAKMRRMRITKDGERDELLSALNLILNGKRHLVRRPRNPVHLDTMLARSLFASSMQFAHDEDYVAVLGVTEFPMDVLPGAIGALKRLSVDFRVSARFIFLDSFEAERKLERLESRWSQMTTLLKTTKISGSVDLHAEERAGEIPYALKKLRDGHVRYGHYTFNVVLRGPTQEAANEKARLVQSVLEGLGFSPVLESMNKLPAFLGSLPGHGKENVRKPLISTENLSSLCDFDRAWPGDAECQNKMMPRAGALMRVRNWHGGYFDLNLHLRDVGHTLIFGKTGSGKTTLVAHMVSQFLRYPGARVVALDYDEGLLPITTARKNSAHYALGEMRGAPALCPLAELESPEDVDWAGQWIELLCALQGLVDREASKQIRRAVRELAAIPPQLGTGRRLTDLVPHLQNDDIESILDAYTVGIGGQLLNGSRTDLRPARVTTYEVAKLLQLDIKMAAPTLAFIFRQIEKMLDGRPLMIVLSEAWVSLSHPQCYPFVRRLLNTARKKNGFLVMDTQQVEQVATSPIAEAVFSACPTRIIYAGSCTDVVQDMYRTKLGLSDQQIKDLNDLAPSSDSSRRWSLFSQGDRSRLFTLDLSRAGQAFCATNKPQAARIKQLTEKHGENWPRFWLDECGFEDLSQRFEELQG